MHSKTFRAPLAINREVIEHFKTLAEQFECSLEVTDTDATSQHITIVSEKPLNDQQIFLLGIDLGIAASQNIWERAFKR